MPISTGMPLHPRLPRTGSAQPVFEAGQSRDALQDDQEQDEEDDIAFIHVTIGGLGCCPKVDPLICYLGALIPFP